MNEPVCKTCIHYRQHYVLDEQRCTSVNCGHCIYPRVKHREPNTKACQHYDQRTEPPSLPDRNHVLHFLTTEFLQYILNLDLPPEQK